MEVVKQMQNAIRFIEKNLLEDITFNDVANHVYMSAFNFHRTFKIFTNITPNEYIRNRRLSEAGEEILFFEGTLLDLSLKYRYESFEGFNKAFKRFHGVTPNIAKKGSVTLTIYHPLTIHISFEGGKGMDYKIITLEPFTLLGKTRQFDIDAEVNLIPSFWDDEIKKGLLKELSVYAVDGAVYGACHQENKDATTFNYSISVKVDNDIEVSGLDKVLINNPLWAVFECHSVDHIGKTWDYILKQFLVNSDYERVEILDFEYYTDAKDNFCDLYIPVKRK